MSNFDEADCLRRYNVLVQQRPELFVNPSGDIYEILLDPERVLHAQREATYRRTREGLTTEDVRVGVLAIDPYLLLMREAVRFADGSYGLYNRLVVPSGAAILPILHDSVVLLYRFRHGTRRWHLEAPRGSFTGSGGYEDDARRELREETGAEAVELIDLGELHSTTGCLDEAHRLYLARIDAVGEADRHEAISEIKVIRISDAQDLIAQGEITDGPTLALFLRAQLRGYF